jgi:hypothetical protein
LFHFYKSKQKSQFLRSAALIQVFFSGQLPDEVILSKFEGYAEAMRTVLANYEALSRELAGNLPEPCTPREHFFWLLTLDLGLRSVRENIVWAENVIEQLKNGTVPQG